MLHPIPCPSNEPSPYPLQTCLYCILGHWCPVAWYLHRFTCWICIVWQRIRALYSFSPRPFDPATRFAYMFQDAVLCGHCLMPTAQHCPPLHRVGSGNLRYCTILGYMHTRHVKGHVASVYASRPELLHAVIWGTCNSRLLGEKDYKVYDGYCLGKVVDVFVGNVQLEFHNGCHVKQGKAKR